MKAEPLTKRAGSGFQIRIRNPLKGSKDPEDPKSSQNIKDPEHWFQEQGRTWILDRFRIRDPSCYI